MKLKGVGFHSKSKSKETLKKMNIKYSRLLRIEFCLH